MEELNITILHDHRTILQRRPSLRADVTTMLMHPTQSSTVAPLPACRCLTVIRRRRFEATDSATCRHLLDYHNSAQASRGHDQNCLHRGGRGNLQPH